MIEIEINQRSIERIATEGGREIAEYYFDWIVSDGNITVASGVSSNLPFNEISLILKNTND